MDAYTVALTLLSARELSEAQLRARLTRRRLEAGDIESALSRLKKDGTLSDRRVAMAIGRMESAVKSRGRARVIQKIRQAGIDGHTAAQAVSEVFQDVDENALLERALERRLRGTALEELDQKGRARIIRGLVGQGFPLEAVLKRIR